MQKIVNNKIIQEDLEYSANCEYFDKNILKNKTILITGSTGFIGKQLVFTMLCMNKLHNLNIKIIAMARNKEKLENIFSDFLDDELFIPYIQDMTENINVDEKVDFIVHSANIVESKLFIQNPVEVIESTFLGIRNILKFAQKHHVESVVFLSSMEVYGQINVPQIKENDYGFIDPLSIRSSYPQSKLLSELLCMSYFSQYSLPIKIIRLSQVYGGGVFLP